MNSLSHEIFSNCRGKRVHEEAIPHHLAYAVTAASGGTSGKVTAYAWCLLLAARAADGKGITLQILFTNPPFCGALFASAARTGWMDYWRALNRHDAAFKRRQEDVVTVEELLMVKDFINLVLT